MVAFYEIYKLAKSCPGVQVQENAKILHFPQIVTIYNWNLSVQLLFFGLASPLRVCLTDQTAILAF